MRFSSCSTSAWVERTSDRRMPIRDFDGVTSLNQEQPVHSGMTSLLHQARSAVLLVGFAPLLGPACFFLQLSRPLLLSASLFPLVAITLVGKALFFANPFVALLVQACLFQELLLPLFLGRLCFATFLISLFVECFDES